MPLETSLDGILRIANVTRGTTFDAPVKSNDVHDLRLPMAHGTSRTPTIDRLFES